MALYTAILWSEGKPCIQKIVARSSRKAALKFFEREAAAISTEKSKLEVRGLARLHSTSIHFVPKVGRPNKYGARRADVMSWLAGRKKGL